MNPYIMHNEQIWPTWTFLSCKRIGLIPLVNCSDVTPSISCKQFVLWTELKGSNIISYSWIALKHNPLQIKTATAAGSPAFNYFRTRKFKHEIRSFLHMISLLLYVFLKMECCWGLFGKGKVIILHSFWKERQLFFCAYRSIRQAPQTVKGNTFFAINTSRGLSPLLLISPPQPLIRTKKGQP